MLKPIQIQYLPLCSQYLPGFPIIHIGFSIKYARKFLSVPGVHFNLLQHAMVGPCGDSFIKDARAAGRSIFLWTINDETTMKWCIYKGVDGVITDDPKKYLEVSKGYRGEKARLTVQTLASAMWINVLILIFGPLYRHRARLQKAKEKQKRSMRQPDRPS
jgi:phosphatidylglycerol phospholipase C